MISAGVWKRLLARGQGIYTVDGSQWSEKLRVDRGDTARSIGASGLGTVCVMRRFHNKHRLASTTHSCRAARAKVSRSPNRTSPATCALARRMKGIALTYPIFSIALNRTLATMGCEQGALPCLRRSSPLLKFHT